MSTQHLNKYKNRNVFVTGGAGFIGCEIVKQLVDLGANVTVYDNISSGHLDNIQSFKVNFVKGDILDKQFLIKHMKNNTHVFHLAAMPFIPDCYDHPVEFTEVNVIGTLNVVLAAKQIGADVIINVSSSEVYGTAQYTPIDENHPTLPSSTYAVSKLAADRLTHSLYYEQNIPTIIVRAFNVFGPRDSHPRIIPIIISQLHKSNKVKLGNISSSRDFTYVEDTARGVLLAGLSKKLIGDHINLGTNRAIRIVDLVYLIGDIMGVEPEIVIDKKLFRPFDVDVLRAEYKKAKKLLGWGPKISLEEGLKRTIDWYQKNGKWAWEK